MRRLAALSSRSWPPPSLTPRRRSPARGRLIHGAGNNFLNDVAGARAYWTEDAARRHAQRTVPYLVVHYDSNQIMDGGRAGGGPIYDWMNANAIDDIVVNTHSFGGTVIR
jgi:hypothetical protein